MSLYISKDSGSSAKMRQRTKGIAVSVLVKPPSSSYTGQETQKCGKNRWKMYVLRVITISTDRWLCSGFFLSLLNWNLRSILLH